MPGSEKGYGPWSFRIIIIKMMEKSRSAWKNFAVNYIRPSIPFPKKAGVFLE
jgi:hypothetical protein